MTEDKFIEWKAFFNEALTFSESETKLTNLTRALPSIYQKAIGILTDQLQEVKTIGLVRDEIYSKLYSNQKIGQGRSYSSKEIDILIKSEKKYVDICVEYNKQEVYFKYLEATIDNIKKISFQIKNYIDMKKFFAGDY
jgi:endonuclease IV